MAPEYAIDGLFSIKSDVFSFGILLLEIVSGMKNKGMLSFPSESYNLIAHVSNKDNFNTFSYNEVFNNHWFELL